MGFPSTGHVSLLNPGISVPSTGPQILVMLETYLVHPGSLGRNPSTGMIPNQDPPRRAILKGAVQASRKFFAVGFAKQVELYDALRFQVLFSHLARRPWPPSAKVSPVGPPVVGVGVLERQDRGAR